MSSKKDIDQLINNFVAAEKDTAFNPFLSTRVMAAIDKQRTEKLFVFSPVWRTAVMAVSLFIAVFAGIAAGSLYQSKNDVADMVLMNDASMENFALYNQMSNE
ncbi:hypothetical protein [Ferruginibacter sp.]|nr:hypothetical protein [Ferruginibacter sp.]